LGLIKPFIQPLTAENAEAAKEGTEVNEKNHSINSAFSVLSVYSVDRLGLKFRIYNPNKGNRPSDFGANFFLGL